MINREQFYQEFSQINIYCFDLMKYRRLAERLNFSVWLNFRSKTYFSEDIFVDPESFCVWTGKDWVLIKGHEIIKIRGIQMILDYLEVNYEENTDGHTKFLIE